MADSLLPPGRTRPLPAFYALGRGGNVHHTKTDVSITSTATTLPPYNVGATHIISYVQRGNLLPAILRIHLYPPVLG